MSVTTHVILSDSEFANLRIVADRLGWSKAKVQREALKDFSIKIAKRLRETKRTEKGITMMTCNTYASKKELKSCIGEKMRYEETSFFGPQFVPSGINYFARRPHLCNPPGGREFFCNVLTKYGRIMEVK